MSEYDTKPTIETVLEAIQRLQNAMVDQFEGISKRLDGIDREMRHQDDKLDSFILDVIDMKREMRRA